VQELVEPPTSIAEGEQLTDVPVVTALTDIGNVPELGSLSPSPEKEPVTVAEPAPVPVTVTEQLPPTPERVHVEKEKETLPASDHEIVSPSTVEGPKAAPETVAVQVVMEPTLSVEAPQVTVVPVVAATTVNELRQPSAAVAALYWPACNPETD
jgi:hypothetical protein